MGKRGPAPIKIDWKLIENMAAIQCTANEISGVIGVSVDTLERASKREHKLELNQFLSMHSSKGHVSLRRRIWKKAIEEGNTATLIFLAKAYLGLRDGFTYIQPNDAKTENGESKQVIVYESQFTTINDSSES